MRALVVRHARKGSGLVQTVLDLLADFIQVLHFALVTPAIALRLHVTASGDAYLVDVGLLLLGRHQLPLIGDGAEDVALLGLLAELLADLFEAVWEERRVEGYTEWL